MYEAKRFKKRLVFDGIPVLLRARLFIHKGQVRAVRSVHLRTLQGMPFPQVDDGRLERLPPPHSIWPTPRQLRDTANSPWEEVE